MAEADPLDEVAELFELVLPLPPPEREALLAERCRGRPGLRREIDSLLRHATPGPLDSPPPTDTALAEFADEPRRVGPYTLVDRLGEGGFGVVWRAEQSEPVVRTVALKLVKPGLGSAATLARFAAERQALARLDHPGIARMYDAGTTADGRPWFAMELVEGRPITEWCRSARRGLADRLRLLVEVCDALRHAHERGIVHRDLKPTNVLVAHDGGRTRPKVIDFGVAKAFEQPLPGAALRTEVGQIVGTPAYMSPEQARGDVAAIDARTDVYALGVLLFELLTGTLPFYCEDAGTPDLVELQRRIREDDAPRPSSRIVERSLLPGYRPPVLARAVRGDLDWIVLRALEKDPDRRYPSVADLARDLERFLRDEPVSAGPPGRLYRLKKLVRRHKATSAAVCAAFLLFVAGVTGTVINLVRARQSEAAAVAEATKLRAVAGFLREMLSGANPERGLGRDVTVAQILDDAARRLDGDLVPDVETLLRTTVGAAYRALGRDAEAEAQLERALVLADRTAHGLRSEVRRELGLLCVDKGRHADADRLLTEAVTFAPDGSLERIRALGALGTLRIAEARLAEGETALTEAIALADGHPDAAPQRTSLRVLLGELLERAGHYADAERVIADARERAEHEGPSGRYRSLHADAILSVLLIRRGEPARAEPVLRRCIALAETLHGADHPEVARQTCLLAELLQELDRLPEAKALFEAGLAVLRRAAPEGSPAEASALGNLAWTLERLGEDAAAMATLRRSLAMKRRVFHDRHPEVASSLNDLSLLLRERQAFDDAESAGAEALAIYREVHGDRHPHTAVAAHSLGVTLAARGEPERALPLLEEALGTALEVMPSDHWQVAEFRKRLGRALMAVGRHEDARPQFLAAYAAMLATHGPEHRRTVSAVKAMVDLSLEIRDWEGAGEWRRKLPEAQRDYAVEAERMLRARG